MNKNPLESNASHVRYMDFIAPKSKPIPSGRPVKDLKPAQKPAPKPVSKPAQKPVQKPTQAQAPKLDKKESPDAASYTLGGKSPFLTSVTVEKRPLSGAAPTKPAKNIYPDKKPIVPEQKKTEPTKIIKKKEKKSGGFGVFLIIVLTIILGALVGAAAYFVLPK